MKSTIKMAVTYSASSQILPIYMYINSTIDMLISGLPHQGHLNKSCISHHLPT